MAIVKAPIPEIILPITRREKLFPNPTNREPVRVMANDHIPTYLEP